jgi:hypothetical protein
MSMNNKAKIAIVALSTVLSLVLLIGALPGQYKDSKEPYRELAVLT